MNCENSRCGRNIPEDSEYCPFCSNRQTTAYETKLAKQYKLTQHFTALFGVVFLLWFCFYYWSNGGLANKIGVVFIVLISMVVLFCIYEELITIKIKDGSHWAHSGEVVKNKTVRHPATVIVFELWFLLLAIILFMYPTSVWSGWWVVLGGGGVIALLYSTVDDYTKSEYINGGSNSSGWRSVINGEIQNYEASASTKGIGGNILIVIAFIAGGLLLLFLIVNILSWLPSLL